MLKKSVWATAKQVIASLLDSGRGVTWQVVGQVAHFTTEVLFLAKLPARGNGYGSSFAFSLPPLIPVLSRIAPRKEVQTDTGQTSLSFVAGTEGQRAAHGSDREGVGFVGPRSNRSESVGGTKRATGFRFDFGLRSESSRQMDWQRLRVWRTVKLRLHSLRENEHGAFVMGSSYICHLNHAFENLMEGHIRELGGRV